MKKIILLISLVISFIGCSNSEVKNKPLIVPLHLEVKEAKQEEINKVIDKTVIVNKVKKNKIIQKRVIDTPYTEYIFDKRK